MFAQEGWSFHTEGSIGKQSFWFKWLLPLQMTDSGSGVCGHLVVSVLAGFGGLRDGGLNGAATMLAAMASQTPPRCNQRAYCNMRRAGYLVEKLRHDRHCKTSMQPALAWHGAVNLVVAVTVAAVHAAHQ